MLRLTPRAAPSAAVPERCFAHAFGNSRRVLVFGGKIVAAGCDLFLKDFLLTCSGELAPAEAARLLQRTCSALERGGWRTSARPCESPTWTADDFSLAWTEGEHTPGQRLVHLVLTCGDPDGELFRRVFGYVSAHVRNLGGGEAAEPASPPARDGVASCLEAGDLALALAGRRVAAFTGAGVSRASGILPFEGDGSLGGRVPLMDDFPGAVLEWIAERPAELATLLAGFHATLYTAEPNAAHVAIAQLERLNVVSGLATTNFDRLHERAGSRRVERPLNSDDPLTVAAGADLLLVVGVSADEHGLVSRFRSAGGRVIAVDPEPPSFLRRGDALVRGCAEVMLPRVVALVRDGRREARRPPAPCTAERFVRLAAQVRETARGSTLHGDGHWRRVARIGARLATVESGCDPWIVLLFALLHDAGREHDGHDPGHGPRAAARARALEGAGFALGPRRLMLLESACFAHADGEVSHDPTVGVCWDADRLDLWRCGMTPDPRYLSSCAALDPATIRWSERPPDADPTWEELYAAYTLIAREEPA